MKDAAAREQTDTETGATGHGLRVPFSEDETRPVTGDSPPLAPERRKWLARLVAAKLVLDLLFVGGFALYTHEVNYSRRGFDGALEHADGLGARGWVVDLERPGEAVEVQLFLNGSFASAALASAPRTDEPTGASSEGARRAFVFEFERPRYGEYDARVYAVREGRGGTRRTLRPLGDSRHFSWK